MCFQSSKNRAMHKRLQYQHLCSKAQNEMQHNHVCTSPCPDIAFQCVNSWLFFLIKKPLEQNTLLHWKEYCITDILLRKKAWRTTKSTAAISQPLRCLLDINGKEQMLHRNVHKDKQHKLSRRRREGLLHSSNRRHGEKKICATNSNNRHRPVMIRETSYWLDVDHFLIPWGHRQIKDKKVVIHVYQATAYTAITSQLSNNSENTMRIRGADVFCSLAHNHSTHEIVNEYPLHFDTDTENKTCLPGDRTETQLSALAFARKTARRNPATPQRNRE